MFICYFDESGDDGYPSYSSDLFVLSCIYMHDSFWKENYQIIQSFRGHLKATFNFPIKQEFHTKEFITNKSVYHNLYEERDRKNILTQHCQLLASLNVKCISIVIDKKNINRPKYDVLKNALTYAIQRIENDLNNLSSERFIIITDEGRISKMRTTARSLQRINYIPSKWKGSYRKEIQNLIEDPLPKDSKESYFIQLADMLSFIVSLYAKNNLCSLKIDWGKRIKTVLNSGDEIQLLNMLKRKLNLKASNNNEYGIVYYPKNK